MMNRLKEVFEVLDVLGLGLSRLVRYSYGGFLLILLGSIVNSEATGKIVTSINPVIMPLVAIVVGAGIYAAHRGLVIPLHHLLLCFLLWLMERLRKVEPQNSWSPTRWLGGHLGIWPFQRMWAYSILRRSNLWDAEKKKELNLAHAENGLVVMTFEGFLAAAFFVACYPEQSLVKAWVLLVLSVVFLIASYPMAFEQHCLECRYMQKKEKQVKQILKNSGLLTRKIG